LDAQAGSVAVVLEQASTIGPQVEFLSSVASILLLGVSGGMCGVIAVLLVAARRGKPAVRKVRE
jgi:hypothetical protein